MKEVVLEQLKENVSVWFSSKQSTTLDSDDNILDNHLYDFSHLLHSKDMSKNKKIVLDIISYDHAMCITETLVENGEVKQFKVDNSFGLHGKFDGNSLL